MEVKSEPITIIIRDNDGTQLKMKCKPKMAFSRLVETYAKRKKVDAKLLIFTFNEVLLVPSMTINDLGIVDGDTIDCNSRQKGAGQ